jgi:hypothetical protein
MGDMGKFHPNNPQILSATAQNFVVQVAKHQHTCTAVYHHSLKHDVFHMREPRSPASVPRKKKITNTVDYTKQRVSFC